MAAYTYPVRNFWPQVGAPLAPAEEPAHVKAERLLRTRLSPEQLAEFETPRPGVFADPRYVCRAFTVIGSLGGRYTLSAVFSADPNTPYTTYVNVNFADNPHGRDWCVYAYSAQRVGRASAYIPIGDQMLAFKLVLETNEALFLGQAVPMTPRAAAYRDFHREAVSQTAAAAARPQVIPFYP